MQGEGDEAAAAGIDEDDELDEGMTTLSALLDESDEEADGMRSHQQRRRTAAGSSRIAAPQRRGRAAVRADDAASAEDEEVVLGDAEEGGEDVQDDDDDGDEEEEEDDAAAVSAKRSRLLSMVQALDADGRQRAEQADSADRTVAAAESALEESEFAAISMPSSTSAQRQRQPTLTLQALMQSLPSAGESGRNVAALKRRLAALTGAASSSSSSAASAAAAAGALPEPLPEVRQEELTRRLGYEAVQKQIERWAPIVERNMTATTLHFPLHAPPVHAHSSASMQAQFHSSSSHRLEQELAAIMKEYGLKGRGAGGGDGGVERTEAEELRARELTAEEVQRRRAELGKLKSLLFHAELKQRRINRIKSRTYRRLRKRQRERAELSLDELQQVDPEEAERRRLKAELERVKERMTLSHTNSSTWMRRQLRMQQQSGGGNAEVKQAVQQAAVIKQRLRQKQQPDDEAEGEEEADGLSDEDEADADDTEEEEDEEEAQASSGMSKAEQLKAAMRELERERSSEEEEGEEAVGFDPPSDAAAGRQASGPSSTGSRSSVLGLKFMQRAMEQKRQQTKEARQQLADELKEQLQREGLDSDEEEPEEKEVAGRSATEAEERSSETARGRRRVGAEPADDAMQGRSDSVRASVQLQPNSFRAVQADRAVFVDGFIDIEQELQQQQAIDAASSSKPQHALSTPAQTTEARGVRGVATAKQNAGKRAVITAEAPSRRRAGRYHEAAEEKDGSSGAYAAGEREEENPWAQATDVSARKELREETQKKRRRRRQRHSDKQQETADAAPASAAVSLPANIDVRALLSSSNSSKAAASSSSSSSAPNQLSLLEDDAADDEQSALVAEAFAAGEDEEANFAAMKAAVVQAALPQMDSVLAPALPGWGSWTGEGVRPAAPSARQQQQQREAQRRLLQLQQRAVSARSDRSLPHVLISEKSERRASKYLLQRLPFPFTSVDAYEQSLLQPLGKEWNSQQAHLKVITPSVVVRKGAVIEPIDYQHSAREINRDEDKEHGQAPAKKRGRQRGAETASRGRRKEGDAKAKKSNAAASGGKAVLAAPGGGRVVQRA